MENETTAAETVTMLYKFLGTDDAVNTCDCCGRKNLKATAALESLEDGEIVHFGLTCAARAVKWGVKETKAAINAADKAKADAARAVKAAADDARLARWDSWVKTNSYGLVVAGSDLFTRIQALGGYAAARARYLADGENE